MDNDNKFIFVFRVENENDGLGPYTKITNKKFPRNLDRMADKHNASKYHTFLSQEVGDISFFAQDKHFFAFASLEHLFAWFKGNINTLHVNGYKISIYKVSQKYIVLGERQCVFEKAQATKLGLFSLRTKREVLERKIGRLAEENLLTTS